MLGKQDTGTAEFQMIIRDILDTEYPWMYSEEGKYTYEIDASYEDELETSIIERILKDSHPKEEFWQTLDTCYEDCIFHIQNELYKKIKQSLLEHSDLRDLTTHEEEMIESFIQENITVVPPEKHFLKQSVLVNIFVDTGDGNYDFSLNPHYPCFYGNRQGEPIDSKAGIVWLAKQQGHTKKELQKALDEGDMSNPNGFLQSCRVEETNLSSSMPVVTFLVEMELQKLIGLNVLIQLTKHFKTSRSYIALDKETVAGLYDPFNGGGGILGIELERDVKLPIMYIRSALPDGCDGYSIRSCYCMDEREYKETVKELYVSRKLHRTWSNLSF